MIVLGIETSCDETSAAVVEETGDATRPWAIRSNVIASQVADPPRVGRRRSGARVASARPRHLRRRGTRARRTARATWSDLGAIAVTQGPGLVGSLLVGVSFAKAAAAAASAAARRRPSPRRSHRVARPAQRRAAAARGRPRRLGRAHQPLPGGGTRFVPAAQPDPGRCGRRSVRQGGKAARPRLPGWSRDRPAGEERQRPRDPLARRLA